MKVTSAINSSFWGAPEMEALSLFAKYLYVYLIATNENTLGVSERSLRRMSFDTGLTEHEVEASLSELSKAGLAVADGTTISLVKWLRVRPYLLAPRYSKTLRNHFNSLCSDTIREALAREYRGKFCVEREDKRFDEEYDDGEVSHCCD